MPVQGSVSPDDHMMMMIVAKRFRTSLIKMNKLLDPSRHDQLLIDIWHGTAITEQPYGLRTSLIAMTTDKSIFYVITNAQSGF